MATLDLRCASRSASRCQLLLEKLSRKRLLTKTASETLPKKMVPSHSAFILLKIADDCFASLMDPVRTRTTFEMIVQNTFIENGAAHMGAAFKVSSSASVCPR
jgi:hypothetical protein